MKIISWNVNGLRSVYRKGFFKWFWKVNADIVCLQEIKANKDQVDGSLINPKGYYSYFNSAERKGYSGVLVYTKKKPISVEKKLGMERFDREGRILEMKYGNFTLINLYLPHGGRGKENLPYKLEVYRKLIEKVKSGKKLILVGDFNIAHEEIDLARPKNNLNGIMFTSKERKQIDTLVGNGLMDTFRMFNKEGGNYTWWSYMRNARERNLGWRIDYCFVSKDLRGKVKKAFILPSVKGSDHCPVGIDIFI